MQTTIEFEGELHRRYPPLDHNGEEIKVAGAASKQISVTGGKVEVKASGDADDIRAKYATPARSESTVSQNEEKNQDVFDRMQAKATKTGNKSKITKRTYKFEG